MIAAPCTTPQLEVIIPVKDRLEIEQCVRSLLLPPVVRILLCDGGSTDPDCVALLQKLAQLPQVILLSFPEPGFNKARLLNQGLRAAKSAIVLISDADIVWEPQNLNLMLKQVMAQDHLLCSVAEVQESNPAQGAAARDRYSYWIDPTGQQMQIRTESPESALIRPGCGLLCGQRGTFLAVGGYKEQFQGWGWEDQDLLIRSELLGISIRSIGHVIHLSHPDQQRNRFTGGESPQMTRDRNILRSCEALSSGILLGDLVPAESTRLQFRSIRVTLPESLSSLAHPESISPM